MENLIDDFRSQFGEIIYSGTLVETKNTLNFKLCGRSLMFRGAMCYQPYVKILKSAATDAINRELHHQQLFHSGELIPIREE